VKGQPETRRCWLARAAAAGLGADPVARSAAATFGTDPAAPVHALLVGCSHYPQLSPWRQLPGASADVALMRRTLQARYGERLHWQALDSADASAIPTHVAMMRAMDRWAADPPSGATAWLYLAGHGTQRPQLSARRNAATTGAWPRYREPDGLDEIFLPVDCGRWHAPTGTVARSVSDDAIGERLALLRARGVTVVAMFDTCHAAGMDRSAPGSGAALPGPTRARAVPLQELGGHALPTVAHATRPLETSVAGTTFLYACRPHEVTHEGSVANGDRAPRRHGFFTWHLVQAWLELASAAGAPSQARTGLDHGYKPRRWRLRDLEHSVHRRYAVERRVNVHPQFIGTADPLGGTG
jgi:hypothetical protein